MLIGNHCAGRRWRRSWGSLADFAARVRCLASRETEEIEYAQARCSKHYARDSSSRAPG